MRYALSYDELHTMLKIFPKYLAQTKLQEPIEDHSTVLWTSTLAMFVLDHGHDLVPGLVEEEDRHQSRVRLVDQEAVGLEWVLVEEASTGEPGDTLVAEASWELAEDGALLAVQVAEAGAAAEVEKEEGPSVVPSQCQYPVEQVERPIRLKEELQTAHPIRLPEELQKAHPIRLS